MQQRLWASSEKKLLHGVVQQPLSRMQHPDFQSELTTVSQNLHRVSSFVESNLGIINNSIQVGIALFALYCIHPYLALGLVTASSPRLIASRLQMRDRVARDEANKEDNKHFWNGRWAMLQPATLKEVLLFGRAHERATKLADRCQQIQMRENELQQRTARRDGISDTASQLGLGCGIMGLIHLFNTGSINYEMAGLALGAMSKLGDQLATFGKLVATYGESLSMVKRFTLVTSEQAVAPRSAEDQQEVERALEVAKKFGVSLELDNVTFFYPKQDDSCINQLSVSINPGDFIILTGKNGGGKSTLISLVAGLYSPKEGTVKANGVDLRKFRTDEWLQNLGILSQDFILTQGGTIRENIEYGHLEDRPGISCEQAAHMAGVDVFVKDLPNGYETVVGEIFEGGKKFSGGQAQRIALARALARKAPILVLDEPTAHLDSDGEKLLFDSLAQLKKDEGYDPTIIYITHRFNRAEDADKIIVLSKGSIEAIGSHTELMSNTDGTYPRLYRQDRSRSDEEREALSE
jgi:ABC-type multidrug transport system fused ATPase/permease subunit